MHASEKTKLAAVEEWLFQARINWHAISRLPDDAEKVDLLPHINTLIDQCQAALDNARGLKYEVGRRLL